MKKNKYEGQLVVLEKMDEKGKIEYNSGEYICLRNTSNALYCIKFGGLYNAHNVLTFQIVGNSPWKVVAESPFDIKKEADIIMEEYEFAMKNKKQWIDYVYANAKRSAGRMLELCKSEEIIGASYSYTTTLRIQVRNKTTNEWETQIEV